MKDLSKLGNPGSTSIPSNLPLRANDPNLYIFLQLSQFHLCYSRLHKTLYNLQRNEWPKKNLKIDQFQTCLRGLGE